VGSYFTRTAINTVLTARSRAAV